MPSSLFFCPLNLLINFFFHSSQLFSCNGCIHLYNNGIFLLSLSLQTDAGAPANPQTYGGDLLLGV